MEFTGERYIPSVDGQVKYEHLHRYAICLEFVSGKSVLDLASGEGYGSALLATLADNVFGVDISSEAIDYATKQYRNFTNLKFLKGSCSAVPLPNNSVDVVTSFETIEHHDQHEDMMFEIKRVLKPNGVLIISSPNRLTYSDEPKYSNPFHVKELYYDELVSLLSQNFKFTNIYGQRLATGSFIFPLDEAHENSLNAYTGNINELKKQVCTLRSPIYFVAICSDKADNIQCALDSLYIDESDDLLKVFEMNLPKTGEMIQYTQSELERAYPEWQETQRLLQQAQSEWQETQRLLQQAQSEWQQAQSEWQQAQNIIQAMQTSKFWKMRQFWFKLKQIFIFDH